MASGVALARRWAQASLRVKREEDGERRGGHRFEENWSPPVGPGVSRGKEHIGRRAGRRAPIRRELVPPGGLNYQYGSRMEDDEQACHPADALKCLKGDGQ